MRHQTDDPAGDAAPDRSWSFEVIGSRVLLGVGLISLLLAAAYFVQLSTVQSWLTPPLRVAFGVLAGLALLVGGTARLGSRRNLVAEGLTGLGASILYLSIWGAFGPFQLIREPLAFGAMVLVSASLAFVAWRTRRQSIALFGLAGAMLTPALLAAGPLPPALLALYLCVVCGAMLVLAVHRDYLAVEAATLAGALAYAGALAPNPELHWTANHVAIVAAVLFAEFASALFLAARCGRHLRRRAPGARFAGRHAPVLQRRDRRDAGAAGGGGGRPARSAQLRAAAPPGRA